MGFISSSEDKKYDEIRTSNYISFENGNITRREIQQKKQTKDSEVYYGNNLKKQYLIFIT